MVRVCGWGLEGVWRGARGCVVRVCGGGLEGVCG